MWLEGENVDVSLIKPVSQIGRVHLTQSNESHGMMFRFLSYLGVIHIINKQRMNYEARYQPEDKAHTAV